MARLTLQFGSPRPTPGVPTTLPPFPVLIILAVCCQAIGVWSACPRDVKSQAAGCFTGFSREFQNMKSSHKRLCCGVDVETLRAFCSSYVSGMVCINALRERCPGNPDIDASVKNLNGAEAALESLCSNDRIIEVYARHQSCITRAAPTTDLCFQRHLNTSDSVQLLTTLDTKPLSQFCRNMKGTLHCIQTNVRNRCGEEASELAATLVKPMVRQSTECDYTIATEAPNPRQDEPSPSSHDGGAHSQQGNPSSSSSPLSVSSATVVLLWLAVCVRTILLSS